MASLIRTICGILLLPSVGRPLGGGIVTQRQYSCWIFNATGRLNVKQEELDEMLKEAPGPINFTVFLTMFGEKLKGNVKQKVNSEGL